MLGAIIFICIPETLICKITMHEGKCRDEIEFLMLYKWPFHLLSKSRILSQNANHQIVGMGPKTTYYLQLLYRSNKVIYLLCEIFLSKDLESRKQWQLPFSKVNVKALLFVYWFFLNFLLSYNRRKYFNGHFFWLPVFFGFTTSNGQRS